MGLANLVTLTAQTFLHLTFLTEVWHERVVRRRHPEGDMVFGSGPARKEVVRRGVRREE